MTARDVRTKTAPSPGLAAHAIALGVWKRSWRRWESRFSNRSRAGNEVVDGAKARELVQVGTSKEFPLVHRRGWEAEGPGAVAF